MEYKSEFDQQKKSSQELSNYEKAIEEYTKAINLDSNNPQIYSKRGLVYERLNKIEEAISDYLEAIRIEPKFAEFYENLGHAYFRNKDNVNAILKYKKCITLDAKRFNAMLNLAIIYGSMDDFESAKKYLIDAVTVENRLAKGMKGIEMLEKDGWIYSDEDKDNIKKFLEKPLNPPTEWWEVKTNHDDIKVYKYQTDIRNAILNSEITPNIEARCITNKDGNKTETLWKPVSDSIAKSSLAMRVLFEPVWSHTILGATRGAAIGVIYWLANGVYFFLFKEINIFIGGFFAFLLCTMLLFLIPNKNARIILYGIILAMFAGLIFGGIPYGFEKVFGGFTSFLWELASILAAIVIGILTGGLPGMIIGTIIGLIRKGKIPVSPLAPKEDLLKIVAKGIIIPFVMSAFLGWLFYTYYQPKKIELFLKSVIENKIKRN